MARVEGVVLAKYVIGQSRAVRFLGGLIEKDRIPHALLFCGPTGTGAVAAALAFAQTLHCEGDEKPCDQCPVCRKVRGLNHPDFALLFPFSSRVKEDAARRALQRIIADPYGYSLPEDHTTLSVDHIRGLQRQFAYGTFQGAWRTAVILHADHMRPEAANALLKTLEEPPPRSLLILTSANPDALLPTIVSRCQFLKFPALPPAEIQVALTQRGVDTARADFIARTCSGSFRQALEMVDGNIEESQDRAFRFLDALVWGDECRTYAALEQLASDRQDAFNVLKGTELWLRDVLLVLGGCGAQITHAHRLEDVQRLTRAFGLDQLTEVMNKIESLREMNHRNVNLQLGLVSLWRLVRERAGSALTHG